MSFPVTLLTPGTANEKLNAPLHPDVHAELKTVIESIQSAADHDAADFLTPAQAAAAYQPLDGDLTAIAALSGSAGFLTKTGPNTWVVDSNTYLTAAAADALFLTPTEGDAAYQPKDATLTALAGLTIAANTLTVGTGADAFSQVTFAANKFPARASTGDLEAKSITDFGLSLVDDADAATARATLGLGTLATQSGTFSGTTSGVNTGDQVMPHTVEGRLTLSSNIPVTTSDVTGAGTLYFTPYGGERVRVYNGSIWILKTFSECSIALSITAATLYYVYLDDDAATLVVSTNIPGLQDEVQVMASDPTKLLLGWIYASGTNTTEDSLANRYVINYYNRRYRPLFTCPNYSDGGTSNTYTSNSADYAAINGGTADSVGFISNGEDAIDVSFTYTAAASASASVQIGIGDNSSTTAWAGTSWGASSLPRGVFRFVGVRAVGQRRLHMIADCNSQTQTFTADFVRGGGASDPYGTFLAGGVWG